MCGEYNGSLVGIYIEKLCLLVVVMVVEETKGKMLIVLFVV